MRVVKKTAMKIMLGFLFFGVLAPFGIILPIIGIDYMDRKLDRKGSSYWKQYR